MIHSYNCSTLNQDKSVFFYFFFRYKTRVVMLVLCLQNDFHTILVGVSIKQIKYLINSRESPWKIICIYRVYTECILYIIYNNLHFFLSIFQMIYFLYSIMILKYEYVCYPKCAFSNIHFLKSWKSKSPVL